MEIRDILNTVICGDSLEIMKQLPDKCVDLTVTSPPYNLGNGHHTGNIRHRAYDDDMPEKDYQFWQVEILNQIYRITKDGGSIFYNHKNRIKDGFSITPYEWILKSKWILKQELVWFNGSQNFDKIRFFPMTERIYWLVKDNNTKLENYGNYHDLLRFNPVGTGEEHKRAFPLELAGVFIRCFPNAETIFDPFLGSGTTAVAAKQLKRNFIGIEREQKYCDIAKARLGQELLL